MEVEIKGLQKKDIWDPMNITDILSYKNKTKDNSTSRFNILESRQVYKIQ